MPTLRAIVGFAVAAFALIVVPGPAVLYVVTRAIHQGRRAGVVSAAGIATAVIAHTAAAAFGLSALVARSGAAFTAMKVAGAAYMIVIGVRRLLSKSPALALEDNPRPRSLLALYRQGFVVNLLNPKAALFFLAILPQFVDRHRGSTAKQVMVFGLIFAVIGLCSDSTWGFVAGTIGNRLRGDQRAQRALDRTSGAIFIGLGALALTAARPR